MSEPLNEIDTITNRIADDYVKDLFRLLGWANFGKETKLVTVDSPYLHKDFNEINLDIILRNIQGCIKEGKVYSELIDLSKEDEEDILLTSELDTQGKRIYVRVSSHYLDKIRNDWDQEIRGLETHQKVLECAAVAVYKDLLALDALDDK